MLNKPLSNITYSTNKNEITSIEAEKFFVGWQNKPSEETLRKSIMNADYVVLAIDKSHKKLIGYITAISDNVLSAYIPFLEVEKKYRGQGIGRTLVEMMVKQLDSLYMIDIVCDKKLAGFYEEAGFQSWHAMIKRNYPNQSGTSIQTSD